MLWLFYQHLASDHRPQLAPISMTISRFTALSPLPQTSPPCSVALFPTPHNPLMDSASPALQVTIDKMTRNLALEDVEAGDVGFRDHNIVALRGGAPAAELVEQEGLQVGLMTLKLKC
jgi:hypothetical protein